jgi:transposase
VAERLGITTNSLYKWIKMYGDNAEEYKQQRDQQSEIRRLKSELRRVTEERDILKKATAYFAKESK